MQKIKRTDEVARQIDEIKKQIESLKKNETLLVQVLKKVKGLLIDHHLGIVVFMYYNNSLYGLFSALHTNYQRQKNKDMLQVLYMVFDLAIFMLDLDPQYRKLLKSFSTHLPDMRKYKQFLNKQVIQQYQSFKKLIKKFVDIKYTKNIEPYEKGLRLNEYVNTQLLKYPIKQNYSNEIIISWLRFQVSQLQAKIFKEKGYTAGFCCNMHFQKSQDQFNLDFANHVYLNINPNQPKLFENVVKQKEKNTLVTEVQNIKKWLVYFLNNEGGYLFLGIKEIKARNGVITGIPLSKEDRLNYLIALQSEVITKIFPTDNENEDQDEQAQNNRLQAFRKEKKRLFEKQVEQCYSHSLSELINIDFLHIYNKNNLLFERNSNGNMLFVVRFRVKIGNPAEVYHFLNPKDLPEAYIQYNRPLNMIEYYDLVYSRLKDEANGKLVPKDPKSHPLCIFSLKYHIKKQVQRQPSEKFESDEEDYP